MIELSTIEAPIELVADAPAGTLSPLMQSIARNYLATRQRAGQAILESARYLAEARASARYGEWKIFLEATGTQEDTASRMIAIAERASADQQYALAVSDGRLAFSAAFELLNAPVETQRKAIESSAPTPVSAIRAEKRESKLRNVAEFEETPAPASATPDDSAIKAQIRRLAAGYSMELLWEDDKVILYWPGEDIEAMDALPYALALEWLETEAESAWERYRAANVPEFAPAPPPAAPDPVVEAVAQRTPQDLIDAGLDLRRHGAWFVAIGTRGLMRGWEIRAAAPFDQIVEQARAEIARRTPPPADPEPIPEVSPARLPAVPPRPRRPVSADVSATVAYINQLEAYASALEGFIMALQKKMQ